MRRAISPRSALAYVVVQVVAAALGVFAAHAMFGLPIIQISQKLRDGPALAWSEVVATFGLFVTSLRRVGASRPSPWASPVGLYITAAYWFTALDIVRQPRRHPWRGACPNTFAGIAPASVPGFVAAQMVGAAIATAVFGMGSEESTGP